MEFFGEGCDSVSISRHYLNDSIFIDITKTTIISNNNIFERNDTFKVVNKKWYLKNCNKFRLYFDPIGFKNGDTTFVYNKRCQIVLKRIPLEIDVIDNKELFKMRVETQHYNYFTPTVWFDPEIGIVRILSKASKCEDKILKVVKN